MAKTRSSSDDQGTDPVQSLAPMEPSPSDITTSLHELTQRMANSEQRQSQLLAQFGTMLEDSRLIKSTQHPPPTAYQPLHQMPPPPLNSQFHMQPPLNAQF
jgi:hypothetical protein